MRSPNPITHLFQYYSNTLLFLVLVGIPLALLFLAVVVKLNQPPSLESDDKSSSHGNLTRVERSSP